MSSIVSIPPNIIGGGSSAQEWTLLASKFEQQYGKVHPAFLPSGFMDALKKAKDEKKFLFMYIHSPDHPFTPSFCKETLSSEFVVQFLDFNFLCWGALDNRGEGQEMVTALRVSSFPFCAVVAPAPAANDKLAVLQQMEGPVSPADLLDILLRTKEEQGKAFGIEEKRPMILGPRVQQDAAYFAALERQRKVREEQDAAYLAALKMDQEKEMQKSEPSLRDQAQEMEKAKEKVVVGKQPNQLKPAPAIAVTPQGRFAKREPIQDKEIHKSEPSLPVKAQEKEKAKEKVVVGKQSDQLKPAPSIAVTPQGRYAKREPIQDKEIHKSEPSLPVKAQEKEKAKGKGVRSLFNPFKPAPSTQRTSQGKDIRRTSQGKVTKGELIQILIRFPNGDRREQSFMSTDKIEEIYKYIDSQELPEVENYRLVSSFPRKVYGVDEMGITLQEAGLQQKASLMLERL